MTGADAGVVLVTGGGGLVAREVADVLRSRGCEVHALPRTELDVADAEAVHDLVGRLRPSVIVHCAAFTDVDGCETEPDRAYAVNAEGAGNVASAAASVEAEIVNISTDYVFDGRKGSYTEDDEPAPIQVYGRTKLAGEERVRAATDRHYILRSAWIYGVGGKNFLSKLPKLAASGTPIKAVRDQTGSPTYAPDLAHAIATLAEGGSYGTYHVTNAGSCTFAEFCRRALDLLDADVECEDVSWRDFDRPAARPANTSLVNEAWRGAGFQPLRPWEAALGAFLETGR